jgi:hypothetical protein
MRRQPSPMHVLHLVRLLRVAATEDIRAADTMVRDDFDYLARCLDATLANDAADALEALLRGTVANDHGDAINSLTLPPGQGRRPSPDLAAFKDGALTDLVLA